MKPKKTILCVDDNEQALSIRKIMLETRGYRVLAFNNGEQALEAFRRGGVDLVLTDLIMPGVDGSRLIEEIKTSLSADSRGADLRPHQDLRARNAGRCISCLRECTNPRNCWNAFGCCWCASADLNGRSNSVRGRRGTASDRGVKNG